MPPSDEADMTRAPLPLTLIVAATTSNGIGRSNTLPWHLKSELKYFAHVTSSAPPGKTNAVVMGRKTWEGIPKKFRPLKARRNVVISRGDGAGLAIDTSPDSHLVNSLPAACHLLQASPSSSSLHRTFLIGGAQLYSHCLLDPSASSSPSPFHLERILLTRILSPSFPDCDAFFPEIRPDHQQKAGQGEGGPDERVGKWEQRTHAELEDWVGRQVPEGQVVEGEVTYRFEMWTRAE